MSAYIKSPNTVMASGATLFLGMFDPEGRMFSDSSRIFLWPWNLLKFFINGGE